MRLANRLFAFTAFFLALSSNASQADEDSANRLRAVSQSLEVLQREIPAHYLSPEALAENQDYEPEKIIGWIKQNIQYQPSPGYQLTPQSALRTATGNALEQAVLLQNVLVQAGLEVRLARTTLEHDQAMALLRESFVASPARQWELDPKVREARFKQISRTLGGDENAVSQHFANSEGLTPWRQSGVYNQANALSQNLSKTLQNANAWKDNGELLQPWVNNAQAYYFVKYRFSQGEPWAQAHPAFTSANPTIEESTYVTEGFEDQHHQVTVQAFITRETDGKEETIPVSAVHSQTVASLFENQLQFSTIASGLQKAIEEKSATALQASRFFAPAINGKLAKSARYFTLDGRDLSPAQVNDPMGKIGTVANEKITQMTGALDDALGTPTPGDETTSNPASRLLHYYLTIQWTAPSGVSRTLERSIYRPTADQNAATAQAEITQRAVLAATPATLTPAAELFTSLQDQRAVLALMAKLKTQDYTESQLSRQLGDWSRNRNDLIFNTAVKISRASAGEAALFSQAPVIALRWEKQADEGTPATSESTSNSPTMAFDYLVNSAQTASLAGNVVSINPTQTLVYGVWSTYGEAVLMSGSPQRDSLAVDSISAAGAFNRLSRQGKITVVDANSAGSLPNGSIPPLLQKRILQNPQYAYILPSPNTVGSNNPYDYAYYRVNPATGETLGYSLNGRGVAISETTQLLLIDIATAVTIGKMIGCFFKGGSEGEVVTCLGCTLLQYAIAAVAYGLAPVAAAVAAGVGEVGCSFV